MQFTWPNKKSFTSASSLVWKSRVMHLDSMCSTHWRCRVLPARLKCKNKRSRYFIGNETVIFAASLLVRLQLMTLSLFLLSAAVAWKTSKCPMYSGSYKAALIHTTTTLIEGSSTHAPVECSISVNHWMFTLETTARQQLQFVFLEIRLTLF